MDDSAFWHPLTDQQTATTVGLGYITTNPSDPSVCYWPGPGLIPPFSIGREWITHYTSAKFSSSAREVLTQTSDVDIAEFGKGSTSHEHDGNRKFLSDILITYKLKNPAQFLRDVFRPEYLAEFVSRFDADVPFYLITGYKVSRDAQTVLDQQDEVKNALRFDLSNKLYISPDFSVPHPVGAGTSDDHKVLRTIDFKAPGDSIFFARYQRIEFSKVYPNVLIVPPKPLSWMEWFTCVRRSPSTLIVPDGAAQRILVTTQPLVGAMKQVANSKRLPVTGRRSTQVSEVSEEESYMGPVNRTPTATESTPLLLP